MTYQYQNKFTSQSSDDNLSPFQAKLKATISRLASDSAFNPYLEKGMEEFREILKEDKAAAQAAVTKGLEKMKHTYQSLNDRMFKKRLESIKANFEKICEFLTSVGINYTDKIDSPVNKELLNDRTI